MSDQSIEDASRGEFQQWLKDTGRGWSEIAFEAWQASRQSSQSEPVVVTKEVFEIIGYLVSMASIYDEAHAKHYASKLDSLLSIAAPQQAIPSGLIETLKFYANKANYKTSWDSDSNHVMEDKGEIARNALAAYESASPTAPIERDK
jgi:hypothetical protein